MRSNSLIVGLTVLMSAAGVCHPVTCPILKSIVSPSSPLGHGFPGVQSAPLAHAGIWNVIS